MSENQETICPRCGAWTSGPLYDFEHEYEDMNGHEGKEVWHVCWDCSHDIINGGEVDEDPADIYQRRQEEAYSYDPINNPPPY